ncbi:DNA ligase, partial [Streptomyces sp. SID5785]|uniref:ATP-dependent DNA ligase n=1 Tax=Streptomyces sp. SID5785 TaxID=2690309 RepID=UPI001360E814|nr:DNA ligase [Streptomyces sp. SID5785]
MEYPVAVALAAPAENLPVGPGWWYEPDFEGEPLVLHRTARTVRCQARSGRTVTGVWTDLAVAAQAALPPGVVLDGEAVVWTGGRLDLEAARARARSTARRTSVLAAEYPASYAVRDLLESGGEDLRERPYAERRALLLDLLHDVPPPLQAVPATDDPEVAGVWLESLGAQGISGVVAKRADSPYRAGPVWQVVRGGGRFDAEVVGHTGPPERPQRAAVRLPDGTRA